MPALPPERPGCPKAPGGHRPLPDPAAVRLCLVPDSAPPYDDEVPAGEPPGRVGGRGSADKAGPADGGRRAGGDRPADGGRSAGGDSAGGRSAGGDSAGGRSAGGLRPADGDRLAGGAAPCWQSRFAQVLAETLAGSRPPRQIVPWTTQQAREHIQRLGPRMASTQRPRVRRVVTYRPASDVMEMAVVVGFGSRVRAMAVRLERSVARPPADRGAPGSPLGRGRPAVGGGPTGRGGQSGQPTDRWVCTAVEAA